MMDLGSMFSNVVDVSGSTVTEVSSGGNGTSHSF